MIWAKHIVTHFRDNGHHVEMVHCAGGWLPMAIEDNEVFVRSPDSIRAPD